MEIKFYWNGSFAGTNHSMTINGKNIRLGGIVSNENEAKLKAVEILKQDYGIDFNVDDIVWYKGKSIRKECGETKFKVLSIEPYLIDGIRVDNYLKVNLESLTSGNKVTFFTSHLEKYIGKDFVKEITIDGVNYELTPKQK